MSAMTPAVRRRVLAAVAVAALAAALSPAGPGRAGAVAPPAPPAPPAVPPAVGIAPSADGGGYVVLDADGATLSFGDARQGAPRSAAPAGGRAVGIAAVPGGGWCVADAAGPATARWDPAGRVPLVAVAASAAGCIWLRGDGTVSTPGTHPVRCPAAGPVGVAPAAGRGWLVLSADGTVVACGGARPPALAAPLPPSVRAVGIAATPDGRGYLVLGADGTVRAAGDAVFAGDLAGTDAGEPVAIAANPVGSGYWVLTAAGRVYAFGDAPFYGAQSESVAIFGDSLAVTLGIDLAGTVPPGTAFHDGGIGGCGLAQGEPIISAGTEYQAVVGPCSGTPGTAGWQQLDADCMARWAPDVAVLLVGYWETALRWHDGAWRRVGDPSYDAYLAAQLAAFVDLAHGHGAHVVVLSAPYFAPASVGPLAPAGLATNDAVDAWNALAAQVAGALAPAASLADLNAVVDPGGQYAASVDGVLARAPDGVHFPFYDLADPSSADPDTHAQVAAFGAWIGPWFWQAVRG